MVLLNTGGGLVTFFIFYYSQHLPEQKFSKYLLKMSCFLSINYQKFAVPVAIFCSPSCYLPACSPSSYVMKKMPRSVELWKK